MPHRSWPSKIGLFSCSVYILWKATSSKAARQELLLHREKEVDTTVAPPLWCFYPEHMK